MRPHSAFLIACGFLSACASGGGGTDNDYTAGGGSPTVVPNVLYTVAPAATPTTGSNTATEQFAGAEDFRALAAGTAFPVTQTAVRLRPTRGVTPDVEANASGATLTILDATGRVRLSIPGLGITADLRAPADSSLVDLKFSPAGGLAGGRDVRHGLNTLQYVGLGAWSVDEGEDVEFGHYIAGYQTPPGAVPTTGTASYTGKASGLVLMQDKTSAALEGDASLAVSFSLGAASGVLTNMTARHDTTQTKWNDVLLFTNFGPRGAISGTTQADSAPGTPFALKSGATGTVTGRFYGPAANELGAVWTLSDNGATAMGVLGGKIGPLLTDPCFGCWDY
jgi:hypothetical protein